MKTKKMVTLGMLLGITAILGFTPIGFIQIPPVSITLLHIPTIIAAVLLGPVSGIVVGFGMGFISFVRAIGAAGFDVLFIDPRVSIIPRVLIPITTYYGYILIRKLTKSEKLSITFGAIVGTLTNTVGVLSMLFFLYAQRIIDINGVDVLVRNIIIGAISVNIVVEVIAAAIIATPIAVVLKKVGD
ncbi:putative membrane protein [Natranaerovirga pectinivora]|uniref:Putative membrane protein n=1 Tax=Natranaerovirga pectinivora TaxID=682400 RepID=A0A4R3MPB5_9FIRM|nr:ECF transporter S component [Natranaerovirga pectinivora]TCT14674.1 putative membrane protein [Natranaerovirga pectinivora]